MALTHRHTLVIAAIVAGVIAAVVWLWPRRLTPTDAPAPSERAAPRGGAKAAGRIAPASGGRSAEEIARAQRARSELADKLHAAQATATGAAPTTGLGGVPAGGHVLDRRYIQERVGEIKPLLKECYELALRSDPTLAGRMVVRFDIVGEPNLGGIVEKAELVRGEAADGGEVSHPILDECVKATVESVTFAPPEGGGRVSVTYPFLFSAEP